MNMSVEVRSTLIEKYSEVTPSESSKTWARKRIAANREIRERQDMLTRAGKFRMNKGKVKRRR